VGGGEVRLDPLASSRHPDWRKAREGGRDGGHLFEQIPST